MDARVARVLVVLFSLLSWGVAVLAVLLAAYFGLLMANGVWTGVFEDDSFASLALGVVLIVALVLVALVAVLIALGLWKHRDWVRVPMLWCAVVAAVACSIVIVSPNLFLSRQMTQIAIVWGIVNLIAIWLFGFDHSGKTLFLRTSREERAV